MSSRKDDSEVIAKVQRWVAAARSSGAESLDLNQTHQLKALPKELGTLAQLRVIGDEVKIWRNIAREFDEDDWEMGLNNTQRKLLDISPLAHLPGLHSLAIARRA